MHTSPSFDSICRPSFVSALDSFISLQLGGDGRKHWHKASVWLKPAMSVDSVTCLHF